jgi:hypothetical protein
MRINHAASHWQIGSKISKLQANIVDKDYGSSIGIQLSWWLGILWLYSYSSKAKTAEISGGGSKPKQSKPIEYQYTGDVFLEMFCNPNIWANPFVAKVLITLRDDRIRVSSEVELTRIIEDVDRFMEQFN